MTLTDSSKCKNYPFFCLNCIDYCDKSKIVFDKTFYQADTKNPLNHSYLLNHTVVLLK